MSITDDVFTEDVVDFLRDYYKDEIGELAQRYPSEQRSLYVDYDDLYQWDPQFAEQYRANPQSCRPVLVDGLRAYDLPVDIDLSNAEVRVFNLPTTHDVSDTGRAEQINELLEVRGQVQKKSPVKPKALVIAWKCLRCECLTRVPQVGDERQKPHECRSCERQGPFVLDEGESEFVNHQYARVQEPPEQTQGGNAQSIDVHLQEDITETFEVGDRVTLTAEHQLVTDGDSNVFDTELVGRSVIRDESDYEDIDVESYEDEIKKLANGEYGDPYDLLIDTINPGHYGDEHIKLAIALQLFGGWARDAGDGDRERGDSHVLLVGDPGEGKTTFLRWVDAVAPRSSFASGKGATAAGLTAAAVQDDFGDGQQWTLEAGAMALADGGVACIDEIDKVDEGAISSLHDALESQQVQINKAGINTTLKTRAALLAAGNPEGGRFNTYEPMGQQIDLDPTLLSRFDLIFMVNDQPDPDEDRAVVDHKMRARRAAGKRERGEELTEDERETVQSAIPADLLRAYVAYAKQHSFPILPEGEASEALKDWFVGLRSVAQDDDTSAVPVTFRQEEAIERLAEASARVRLSETVEMQDVERAISLVETSMKQVGYDPDTGQFDIDIIESGQSTSQRNRVRAIEKLFEEAQPDGLTRDELKEHAENIDALDPDTLDGDIETLMKKGLIYDAGGGRYRLT